MSDLEFITKLRLIQLRAADVTASRHSAMSKNGSVHVNASFNLVKSKTENTKCLAKVILEIKGFPKDSNEFKEPVFSYKIEVRGIYLIPQELASHPLPVDEHIIATLCQPVYLFAAHAASAGIRDMGLGGVHIEQDLRTLGDKINAELPASSLPRARKKRITNSGEKK